MTRPSNLNTKQNLLVTENGTLTPADRRAARKRWPNLPPSALQTLAMLIARHGFAIASGDVSWIDHGWYATHTGLLGLASRRNCVGIEVQAVAELCDPNTGRWVFRATVFPTLDSKGFCGYGDADPTNVSEAMRGAELRIAETRAVNRALRKTYGVGLCSLEELGSRLPPLERKETARASQPGKSGRLEVVAAPLLRDQLRQLIRHEQLDAQLVKAYALSFMEVSSLREASREQVAALLTHLQRRLFENRDEFLGELAKLTASDQEVA